MEFLPKYDGLPPKNLYPCLATITIGDVRSGRRMSSGSLSGRSDDGAGGEENALKRVISGGGGRRKSSFGAAAAGGTAEERRASLAPGASGSDNIKGTWYWRVQAGVTDSQLVLLPLSQPPNPILTRPPAPLSEVMPAHSAQPVGGSKTSAAAAGAHDAHAPSGAGAGTHHEEGLIDKLKHLFRRGSNAEEERRASTTAAAVDPHATTGTTAAGTDNVATAATYDTGAAAPAGTEGVVPNKDGKVDKILDQTARGEQLPSAGANAMGATNVNANAETGFPGVLHNGQKCGAIIVGLNNVDKNKIELKGGRAHESSWVSVPVTSYFASMIQGMGEYPAPKSGYIKLEFDKDWIGAKAEAEVLHFYITDALVKRASPQHATLQLPFGGGHPNPGMAEAHAARERAPDAVDPLAPSHAGVASPLTGGIAGVPAGAATSESGTGTTEYTPDASNASDRKVPEPI